MTTGRNKRYSALLLRLDSLATSLWSYVRTSRSLCALSCQDSLADRLLRSYLHLPSLPRLPYLPYVPIYPANYARFNGIESFASDTRQFMPGITKETLRPVCYKRAFELVRMLNGEWRARSCR